VSRNLARPEAFEETFQKLQQVTSQIETSLRTVLAEEGVSLGTLILLRILIDRGAPTTATGLADSMMVTKGAVTQFLDKLEADGLVTRTRMTLDRRVFLITPTEKARVRFRKIRFAAIDELSHAFYGWESSDIRKLQELLSRLMIRNKGIRTILQKSNGKAE